MVNPPHQLSHILDREDSRVLRITFMEGSILRLREFEQVDPSIYGDTGQWCVRVEEPGAGTHPDFERLFRPGSLFDLHESDIWRVV